MRQFPIKSKEKKITIFFLIVLLSITSTAKAQNINELIERYENPKLESEARILAVKELGKTTESKIDALPSLVMLIKVEHKNPKLRIAAINTLNTLDWSNNKAAIESLVIAREDGNSDLRAISADGMKKRNSFAHILDFENIWNIKEGSMPQIKKDPANKTSGGTGTKDDPYLIGTASQLDQVRNLAGRDIHFRQIADIDLKGFGGKAGWKPIVIKTIGSYDGAGYKIKNLYINRHQDNVGLFGSINWSKNDTPGFLRRISLENVDVKGRSRVGGLFGSIGHNIDEKSKNTIIEDCYVTGKVQGHDIVGGLAGQIWGCKTRKCYVSVAVTAQKNDGHPFIARPWYGSTIKDCFYNANIYGHETVASTALKALRQHKPNLDSITALFNMLRSDDAYTRQQAEKSLLNLNPDHEMMIKGLMPAFKDDRFLVRRHAKQVIAKYGKESLKTFIQTLKNAYDVAEEEERDKLIRAAGHFDNTESIGLLCKALEDQNAKVRHTTLDALNWMEIPSIGRYMPLKLKSAWWAKNPNKTKVISALKKRVELEKDPELHKRSEFVLSRINGTATEKPLKYWTPKLSERKKLIKSIYDQVDETIKSEVEIFANDVTWPFGTLDHAVGQLYMGQNLELANRLLLRNLLIATYGTEAGGLGAPMIPIAYALFNSRSPYMPGRISLEVEEIIQDSMATYLKWKSVEFSDYINNTWVLAGTENHHLTFGTLVSYLQLSHLKQIPKYTDMKLHGGKTVSQWCDIWTEYWKKWLEERTLKGLWIEAGSSYLKYSYPGILALYMAADDPIVRQRAKMFLDISLIETAEMSYKYVRGGGKSRSSDSVYGAIAHVIPALHGDKREFNQWHVGLLPTMISTYRAPIEAILLRRNYQNPDTPAIIANHRLGELQGDEGSIFKPDSRTINYLYKTKNYMLGSHLRARTARVSSLYGQTLWSGLVFSSGDGVFPKTIQGGAGRFVNPYYSFQYENVMIFQMLPKAYNTISVGAYFKPNIKKVEKDNWIFVNDGKAYCALKVLEGGYQWDAKNVVMMPDNLSSPMLIHAGDKDKYESFDNFMTTLQNNELTWENQKVTYKSKSLPKIVFFDNQLNKSPTVDDKEFNFSTNKGYSSPWMSSITNESKIKVSIGPLETLYDFNDNSIHSNLSSVTKEIIKILEKK